MKIFYYELRKEFLTRSFFVIFVLTVIANIFWMEWDYQTKGGFNEDFVKTSASEKKIYIMMNCIRGLMESLLQKKCHIFHKNITDTVQ